MTPEKTSLNFSMPINRKIEHFPSQEPCEFFPVDQSFTSTSEDINRIAEVCSQDLIYKRLFEERFNGEPYTKEKAVEFINWAKEGWENKKWFVFLIRNMRGEISACVDIKSDNLDKAEVGYWASQDSPGLVTNAVVTLCEIAKSAGYKSLFVLVIPNNHKSIAVAERAGFANKERVTDKGKKYWKLTKTLNNL